MQLQTQKYSEVRYPISLESTLIISNRAFFLSLKAEIWKMKHLQQEKIIPFQSLNS